MKRFLKQHKKVCIMLCVTAVLLAAGWGVGTVTYRYLTGLEQEMNSTLEYDSNAVEGGWTEADTEAVIESLNEKVEKGMINISMNTTPTFASGTSSGNLMIVNEESNNYPQIVEIIRNDTGETIYQSKAIPVGSKIETAKLDTDLDAGIYECTAFFYNMDPDNGESLGCAGAEIRITVLS